MEENDTGNQQDIKNIKADFSLFITSLGMQALVSMGELLNPASNQKECNLEQARYIIDTIAMLNEKTKGNLNEDESKVVDNILYELRIKYVELNKRQNAT